MFKRRNKRVLKHVERATIEVYKATPGEPLELIQHKDMAYLWPAWLSKQAACRGRRCAFGGRR